MDKDRKVYFKTYKKSRKEAQEKIERELAEKEAKEAETREAARLRKQKSRANRAHIATMFGIKRPVRIWSLWHSPCLCRYINTDDIHSSFCRAMVVEEEEEDVFPIPTQLLEELSPPDEDRLRSPEEFQV